jgi:CheY-like chemotaxis protein
LSAKVDGDTRSRLTELVDGCIDGAGRVRRIVGDLRSFARQREDKKSAVDVHRALDTAIGIADNQVRHRARLVRAYGPHATAYADEGRLTQVFVNLLVNAAQSIPEGRGEDHSITVVTSTHQPGWITVAISDSGVGIQPDVLDRIFEPFFTTKPQGEGTGLGLSVCHGIVTQLGGRIEVSSKVGIGTTFRVVLPCLEPQPAAAVTEVVEPGAAVADAALRVLVVDDEPLIGESVRRALVDHEVAVAHSGADAILMCERTDFDLVLCDLMMPGLSGIDVFETVRARRPELAERFVFMTGGAFTPKARGFLERYEGESLSKPFALKELRELVARWRTTTLAEAAGT